jgi:spoIIIJ-associated protein
MEWVEITARTVEEAKEQALDRLGVAAEDADFEVLSEPKPGLFGRLRGEARVRARVRPAQVRQKPDRRERKGRGRGERTDRPDKPERPDKAARPERTSRSDQADKPAQREPKSGGRGNGGARPRQGGKPRPTADVESAKQVNDTKDGSEPVSAQQVGEEARKFIDDLVSAFAMTATTELIEDGDDLEIRVHGDNLGLLVGPRGTTLQAVQDLARVASQRRLGDHDTRLRVDIGGYRQRCKEALDRFAIQMADEVKESGIARVLEPMSSADRKIVHDALSGIAGITTRSEGDDPYRRVVITPADD